MLLKRMTWSLATLILALAVPALAQDDGRDDGPLPVAEDYRIGIEDELRVFIWGEKDLTVRVQVRPDGKITVPLVNDIKVVGLTPEEVRRKITDELTRYIREPVVTVIVESIKSFRVYFLGEIQRQGALNFYRPTRLLQGIAAAGGLTQFAKKEIVLLREEYGVEKRINIDYKRLINGDPGQENIYLKVGDTLLFR